MNEKKDKLSLMDGEQLPVFAYFIEKLDGVALQMVIFMIVLFTEIAWVGFEHNAMNRKMIKNNRQKRLGSICTGQKGRH